MKRLLCTCFLCLLFLCNLFSLNTESRIQDIQVEPLTSLELKEQHLVALFARMDSLPTDSIKRIYNDSIHAVLVDALKEEDAFYYSFSKVKRLGRVLSYDRFMCLFSWNVLFENHYGYEAVFMDYEGKINTLRQLDNPIQPDELSKYNESNWYGCLYYQLVPYKIHKTKEFVYLLCGWSKVKAESQFKVLDVVSWDKAGNLHLGYPLFSIDDEFSKRRVVFEYYWQVLMSLDYNKSKKRFVFDNLSPLKKTGPLSKMLGPDMSLNAFKRRRKGWYYQEDVKVKNR